MLKRKTIAFMTVAFLAASCIVWLIKGYSGSWYSLWDADAEWQYTILPPSDSLQKGESKIWLRLPFELESVCEFERCAFIAPADINFTVELNGAVIIRTDKFTVWPILSEKNTPAIYAQWSNQPLEIDPVLLHSVLKKGKNEILVSFQHPVPTTDLWKRWRIVVKSPNETSYLSRTRFPSVHEKFSSKDVPVIFMTGADKFIPNEPKIKAEMAIIFGDDTLYTSSINVEMRGTSSKDFAKKQYLFSLQNELGKKNDTTLLGMPAANRWILQGPFADLSHIRNALVFELARRCGEYAPRSRFVELVINNNYRGLYLLTEKPEIHPSRVHWPEMAIHDSIYHGGYLVQINRADSDDFILFTEHAHFVIETPNKKTLNDTAFVNRVESRLAQFDAQLSDKNSRLEDILNFQSFADFILLNELTKNTDAYRLSTFMYNKQLPSDSTFYAGPVWDFDQSLGNCNVNDSHITSGWIYDRNTGIPVFWNTIHDNAEFEKYLVDRYRQLRSSTLTNDAINSIIDSLVSAIEPSLERNFARFTFPNTPFWTYPEIPDNYDEEIDNLKNWIDDRLEWMDQELQD